MHRLFVMYITTLNLRSFRNYSELTLRPSDKLNILVGRNAQGKTSLLEAIYLLATAHSWRTGKDSELVQWGAERAYVSAEVSRRERNDMQVEVALGRSERKQIKINTIRQTKLAELLGQMNVLLIGSRDSTIVAGEPAQRRKFLDLELSQVRPQYCHLLVRYRKVLEQRNRLLRELSGRRRGDGLLEVWNGQLVDYGSEIIRRRLDFVARISDLARVIHAQLTEGGEELGVEYVSSTNAGGASSLQELAARFRDRLEEVRQDEVRRGVSLAGPQRDDVALTVNGVDTRIYGSQGQQRTVALSLRLAELELMEETAKEPPIVLLDDVMADLDEERRAHVFDMTVARCQTFATTVSLRLLEQDLVGQGRVFRLSEGRVTEE